MRSVLGAALLGCGGLMAAVMGLGALAFAILAFAAGGDGWQFIGPIVLACALICAIGVAMVVTGRRQLRRVDRDALDRAQAHVFD